MEKQLKPTESELEILQILWSKGAATVRQINEDLQEHRKVGYTTTLKILQIMFEKGMVTRVEEGRYHVYSASVEERSTQQLMLNRFIHNTFSGSASKLVMEALGNQKVSKEEIIEIKELLKKLEA